MAGPSMFRASVKRFGVENILKARPSMFRASVKQSDVDSMLKATRAYVTPSL
jgi:hypothetical protein